MDKKQVIDWVKQVKKRISEKEPDYGLNKLPSINNDVRQGDVQEIANKIKRLNDGYGAYRKDSDVPNYDEIIDKGELKNKIGEIVFMSPIEYIERTKKGFDQDMNYYIRGFSSEDVAKYANAMYDGDMFPITVIDYSGLSFSQEGRHRSFASYILGVEKIPVLIIKKKEGYEEPIEPEIDKTSDDSSNIPLEPGRGDREIFDLLGINETPLNKDYTMDVRKLFKESKILLEKEKIKGGLADGKTIEDVAKHHDVDMKDLGKEYKDGIEVEYEHTNDREKAKEIALDHLWEDPKYYTKLSTVEDH